VSRIVGSPCCKEGPDTPAISEFLHILVSQRPSIVPISGRAGQQLIRISFSRRLITVVVDLSESAGER
jgi:hypothetical protein